MKLFIIKCSENETMATQQKVNELYNYIAAVGHILRVSLSFIWCFKTVTNVACYHRPHKVINP